MRTVEVARATLLNDDWTRRAFIRGLAGVGVATGALITGCSVGPATNAPASKQTGQGSSADASLPVVAPKGTAQVIARLGHDSGITSGNQKIAEYMAARVAQATDGAMQIQVYPNSQLGSTAAMLNAVKGGTLEFVFPTAGIASTIITPELGALELPYLFTSWTHAAKVEFSQAAELLRAKSLAKGVRILAFAPNALRDLLYNPRGGAIVTKASDVQGMKIRVIPTPIDIAQWKACGAIPTPMAFGEVYSGVQQKVVDGVDNAFNPAASIKLDEVIHAVTLTKHRYQMDLLLANETWFQKLPQAFQAAVTGAAVEASIYQQAYVMADEIRVPDAWAKKGITISTPDDSFRKTMVGIYPQFEGTYGKDLIQMLASLA